MQESVKLLKTNEIDEKVLTKGFIETARMGLLSKEEILEKCREVEGNINKLNIKLDELKESISAYENNHIFSSLQEDTSLPKKHKVENEVYLQYKKCREEHVIWSNYLNELEELLMKYKNFKKNLCFSNIRELLKKHADIKIGQIEKEAGVRLGYTSRLEKDGNTSEPSMEFIVSAAKLLKISIDTLVSIDLAELTPTEQYIVNFFEKLKKDTLEDKLDWNIETTHNLNKIEPSINGNVDHPLFGLETFFEESDCEYPYEVSRVVFNSKSFGPHTYICGDCFNLRLKNGAILYLMDIEKSVHKTNDTSAFAKEAWMYIPNKGRQLLVTSLDNTPIVPILEILFSTVKERMEHPKINNDVKSIIDSFMNNDFKDDIDDLPF